MCTSLRFSNVNDRMLESVTGTHQPGLTHSDVDGLTIIDHDQNQINYIPENITDIFPKLTSLTFGFTRISRISPDDLMQFDGLKMFSSIYNPIKSLPRDLFKHNPDLEAIYFYGADGTLTPTEDNSLSEIERGLLSNLDQLTTVVFSRHYCIQEPQFAYTRSQVIELNEKLPIMCPHPADRTEPPTTVEQQTISSTSEANTDSSTITTQSTTTSAGQISSIEKKSLLLTLIIAMTIHNYQA